MRKIVSCFMLVAAVCLASSCGQPQAEHEHHHDTEQYTVYSSEFELFMEAEPLVVGEESHLLLHLTRLSTFAPLDSAAVSVTLAVGGEEAGCKIPRPSQPGIYSCELTPRKGGCGTLRVEVAQSDTVSVITLNHVHVLASHEELHDHGHDHGHAETPANAIAFTKEQGWKVGLATEVVEPQPFGCVIKAAAQVLPSQGDERAVVAAASGIVTFRNPHLSEGSAVKAGEPLFDIESSGLADNNMAVRYQEALARYSAARSDYERKSSLAEDKIVSQTELQRVRAEYESAKALYDNLKGNFSQKGAIVRSPMSGYVSSVAVGNGAFVEAGSVVAVVSQNRDLMLRAEVQPRYFKQLSAICDVHLLLPGERQAVSLSEMGGALVSYGKSAKPGSPLVPVLFKVRNSGQLLSGSFVTLYITTRSDRQPLALPNGGIVEEMGSFFVFVEITPELFEKRLVTLGVTDGVRTEVLSGLRAGERVVTRGAVMLKMAQGSGTLDPHAGHVH